MNILPPSYIAKTVVYLFIALFLSACASHVRTTVSTFRGNTDLPPSSTFSIRSIDADLKSFDRLEFDYFAGRLAKQLESRGFKVVDDEATHILYLQYDTKRQRKSDDRKNVHIRSAVGYRYRYGSVVVLDDQTTDKFEFARRIKLTIEENDAEKAPVVSLSAVSYGGCEHLSSVFDEITVSILDNLYSESGAVVPVRVPIMRSCAGH